jgi:hypothetical protein
MNNSSSPFVDIQMPIECLLIVVRKVTWARRAVRTSLDSTMAPPVEVPEPPPSECTEAAMFRVATLHSEVYKLGGFQRGTWQRRDFEFNPESQLIVWRKGKQSPVKGYAFVGSGVVIERVTREVKGKHFVLEIGKGVKTRQIAFDTKEELDKWLATLEAVKMQHWA